MFIQHRRLEPTNAGATECLWIHGVLSAAQGDPFNSLVFTYVQVLVVVGEAGGELGPFFSTTTVVIVEKYVLFTRF